MSLDTTNVGFVRVDDVTKASVDSIQVICKVISLLTQEVDKKVSISFDVVCPINNVDVAPLIICMNVLLKVS